MQRNETSESYVHTLYALQTFLLENTPLQMPKSQIVTTYEEIHRASAEES